ncbi:MAG UNVERIFIED_CONTAM: ATP-binding cassette domain-containing protein [Rickettsiaceae bacterium]
MVTSVILTVIWIGGIDVSKGNISSGNMISFVFYALMVAFSIGGMSEVFGEMQKYLAGAERVFEIEKLTDNNKKETDTKLKPPFSIDFEVNSFSYPSRPDVQIIKKICLTGKPGEFIGIVGPSGSGKSTILQIIMGIYTAKNSKLKINNQEIDLSIDNDLRSKIAYIPQDPFLFSSTIEENITLGRDCGSLEEVIKICGLSEMLDALPNGLKTYVGERGAQLSGGQKQRISIARSLYGKPEMLLMDEATSALDNESEVKLLSQLKAHMKDKIIISIAHRLSSITDADKILLISDGEVVANGSHKELIRSSALYSNLAKQNS